jgi:hypothetical protein
MLVGLFIAGMLTAALAVTGTPPGQGPGLVDGVWLNGLANGLNNSYQYGISAAGTTQATATVLPASIAMLEIDTSLTAGTSGVALPSCFAGSQIRLYNNTAYTVYIYPSVTNNPITAAQDLINNTTGGSNVTVTTYATKDISCMKNGVWGAQ